MIFPLEGGGYLVVAEGTRHRIETRGMPIKVGASGLEEAVTLRMLSHRLDDAERELDRMAWAQARALSVLGDVLSRVPVGRHGADNLLCTTLLGDDLRALQNVYNATLPKGPNDHGTRPPEHREEDRAGTSGTKDPRGGKAPRAKGARRKGAK